MVPHPQSRPHQVPQRAPTRPATTPTGGLNPHAKVEPTPSMADGVRLQLPDLGLSILRELSGSEDLPLFSNLGRESQRRATGSETTQPNALPPLHKALSARVHAS